MSDSILNGFAPISGKQASVLILGSMPGKKSLVLNEYYGHPRNAFWSIMDELFGIPFDASYASRVSQLKHHGLALWDVIGACQRTGSLDANIKSASVVPNDFLKFYSQQSNISTVVFNGGRAAVEYKRHVQIKLESKYPDIVYHQLPSTSPANAGMTYSQKARKWSIVKTILEQDAG